MLLGNELAAGIVLLVKQQIHLRVGVKLNLGQRIVRVQTQTQNPALDLRFESNRKLLECLAS